MRGTGIIIAVTAAILLGLIIAGTGLAAGVPAAEYRQGMIYQTPTAGIVPGDIHDAHGDADTEPTSERIPISGILLAVFALGLGTTLAANKPRTYELGDYNDLPVASSTTIYEGSAVGDNASGYMRPLEAGDPFRGFADAKADNSDGTEGEIDVRVIQSGRIVATFSSIAITNVEDDVYMSDDDTFTLTSTSNTWIGKVARWIDSTTAIVAFNVRWYQDIGNADIGADAVDGTKIADDAVSLEHLDSGITPSHIVVFAGEFTTSGGDATETETVMGALDTDIAIATLQTAGNTPRTITTTAVTEDTLTVVFDDDPSTDHVVSYMILRAAG
jgi:hypothetical protein